MAHLSAKLYPLEPSSLTLEAVSKKGTSHQYCLCISDLHNT